MPNHDGYVNTTVRLEAAQVQYCKEQSLNLSDLVRNLLRGYILSKEE